MSQIFSVGALLAFMWVCGLGFSVAQAQEGSLWADEALIDPHTVLATRVNGYQEVLSLSTPGKVSFRARLAQEGQGVSSVLQFEDLEGQPFQTHLQFGCRGMKGGVMVVLC